MPRMVIVLVLASLSLPPWATASVEIAHYPLLSDGLDTTGNNDPMTLENAPFQDGGVYCNGVYWNSSDPDRYLVETPYLESLDFEAFAISAEFKISQHTYRCPVFVGGHTGRWMGVETQLDGTISLLYNNSTVVPSSEVVSLDEWHRALITYDGATDVGNLYLDGRLACSATFVIEHVDRRNISTQNFSNGLAFEGYFRELIVYDGPFVPAPVGAATWGGMKALFR